MPLPLYGQCPRCLGDRVVTAITQSGNGFTASYGEYIQCQVCSGTGEAEIPEIRKILEEEEREAAEVGGQFGHGA